MGKGTQQGQNKRLATHTWFSRALTRLLLAADVTCGAE